MNSIIIYLVEINVVFLVLYLAYRIFFERDRNFLLRRIYLNAIMGISLILPLIPETLRAAASKLAPVAIPLEEITIYAYAPEELSGGSWFSWDLLFYLYLLILGLGLLRLGMQLAGIALVIARAERQQVDGRTVIQSESLHASSFFGFIFLNQAQMNEEIYGHILLHESVHQRERHSIDRILSELFVVLNWFNPAVWFFRRSLIQNLEYLADSAVVREGTNTHSYQLSILNQHIGSASITNQFSSQIKNRIQMLNKSYKRGSTWKIALFFPLIAIAVIAISCSDKEPDVYAIDAENQSESWMNEELFFVVEEMPKFNGGEPIEFRKYIARNLKYPEEAKQNGVSGKIFIKFVVTKDGKVEIPDEAFVAKQEDVNLDEVVVISYRTLDEDQEKPEDKYIQLLKDEVVRVISASPDWEPGKQRGKAVNVMFTFPVSFALQ